jgi:Ca2+-transporting ATPase
MDLAASTSFVVEPAESDLLKRKPRDPNESFMNKSMITGIFTGGITLSALVLAVYFYSWFTTENLAAAQTFAFVSWLFGHVSLAFNMRTNHIPLTKAGIFSSKSFNIWMGGVIVFLLAALNVPMLSEYLKLVPVGIIPVISLAIVAVFAASWMEVRKYLKKKA